MIAILATINDGILSINDKVPSQIFKEHSIADDLVQKDWGTFKRYTSKKHVVMGYNTWKSIGSKPLPGDRLNHYVITSKPRIDSGFSNVEFLTLERFIEIIKSSSIIRDNTVLIGGAQMYERLLPYCASVIWCNFKYDEIDKIINLSEDKIVYFNLCDYINTNDYFKECELEFVQQSTHWHGIEWNKSCRYVINKMNIKRKSKMITKCKLCTQIDKEPSKFIVLHDDKTILSIEIEKDITDSIEQLHKEIEKFHDFCYENELFYLDENCVSNGIFDKDGCIVFRDGYTYSACTTDCEQLDSKDGEFLSLRYNPFNRQFVVHTNIINKVEEDDMDVAVVYTTEDNSFDPLAY